MKRKILLSLLAFADIGGSAVQVKAADCSVNVSACISGNQGRPNAVAKCHAAGQRCAKTGTFDRLAVNLTRAPTDVAAGAAGPDQRGCLKSKGAPRGGPLCERDLSHGAPSEPRLTSQPAMTDNPATSGATLGGTHEQAGNRRPIQGD
jgi:hypothetical protein